MSLSDEQLGTQADIGAAALGLTLTPQSRAAVIANLRILTDQAEIFADVPLAPGDDPLPIFRP